ncbi:hypothetical protein COLO4_01963 [Corchorus olitorius]|uniref:Uncharacterized protein n=1 Tax=Corchorus olitorius TaxID=93759 RepID=A0A1R3L1P7_9ROSI|nr:hypothetical protein COLO4_01963 [Corchorus olitorius]
MDADRRTGTQRGNAEGHGDSVVTVTVHFATAELAAVDDYAVRGRLALDAQGNQAVGHDLDAVGLLHPQLFGATQHGTPFGAGSGNEQYRELVDGQRHQFFRDIDTLEPGATYAQVGHGLAADFTLILQSDVAAHQAQDVDHAGAGRVDANVLEHQLGAFGNRCSHQEERRRRDVCRHFDTGSGELATGLQRSDRAVALDRVTEAAQHALGVVTGSGPARGGRPSGPVSTTAPISRSGLATRFIGRLDSEASPVMVTSNGWPASRPESRRIEVPELPT